MLKRGAPDCISEVVMTPTKREISELQMQLNEIRIRMYILRGQEFIQDNLRMAAAMFNPFVAAGAFMGFASNFVPWYGR